MLTDATDDHKDKFIVVGIITCDEFQKCRFIVQKLYNSFPKRYHSPQVRPMLDVEWDEYLTKVRRKFGNGFWTVNKAVLVFLNDELLGDDRALEKNISKKYRFTLTKDWYEIGKCHLAEYIEDIMSKFRQLAYMTISINNRVIGTMLFELYNDLVPLACENFLTRCKTGFDGYAGTQIHRILKNSWIQCGGFNLHETKMRCENYVVPHDRRGVLSMCNDGVHVNNSTQFYVTLASAPWMDYRYVAFGQLIQGAEVLKKIEEVPTYYQSPKHHVDIVKTGELVFNETPDYVSSVEIDKFRTLKSSALLDTLIGPLRAPYPSVDSFYSPKKTKKHVYPWKPGAKTTTWFSPGYVYPEEGGEKGDYDYLKKFTSPYFSPYYYLNFASRSVLSTPGSSDITI